MKGTSSPVGKVLLALQKNIVGAFSFTYANNSLSYVVKFEPKMKGKKGAGKLCWRKEEKREPNTYPCASCTLLKN